MTRNARFWVNWNDGWVKITLKPEQSLEAGYSRSTDEGWCSWRERWTHDGDSVLRETESDGSDCDGRLTQYYDCQCSIWSLAAYQPEKQTDWVEGVGCEFVPDLDAPMLPQWEEVHSSQRDYAAEAAGY